MTETPSNVKPSCPDEADLLLVALSRDDTEHRALRAHVQSCATCRARTARWRPMLGLLAVATSTSPPATDICLDEVAIAEVCSATGDRARRERSIAHLARCARCRSELVAVASLLADPDVAAAAPRAAPRRIPVRMPWRVAGVLAAASVLAIVVTRNPEEPASQHRGPTITAATAPTPLDPLDGSSGVEFRWTAVPEADRYRLVLFDATGSVLFESETPDTTLALPDSVRITSPGTYLWKVEARTGFDRWVASELIEYQVRSDSLDAIAPRLSDSVLVREVRARPLEVREAVRKTLSASLTGTPSSREQALHTARRIASAYAAAWADSFLVREVGRFARWPEPARAVKVQADSLRLAGIALHASDGADAATVVWRRAMQRSQSIGDSAGVAAALGNIGAAHLREGRADSATASLERARAMAERIGDLRTHANALTALARISEDRGDIAAARDRYSRASALHRHIGDSRGLAADHNNLAGLARSLGDVDEARRQLEAALTINRRDKRADAAATNLVNLAALSALAGELARAELLYREALTTWESNGQWAEAADAMRGLGTLRLRRGDYRGAATELRHALSLYERTGSGRAALEVREETARAVAAGGDLQGAIDLLRDAERTADSLGVDPAVTAGVILTRADLAAQLNDRSEAMRHYTLASSLARRSGNQAKAGAAQEGLGRLYLEQDRLPEARAAFSEAQRFALDAGNRRAAAIAQLLLGHVTLQSGDTIGARRTTAAAAASLRALGDRVATAAAIGEQAALESAAGLTTTALALYRSALEELGILSAPDVAWTLHAGIGAAYRAQGRPTDAAREFRAAIAEVERASGSLVLHERQSGYLGDKRDLYVQLARLEHDRGNASAAFEASERLRISEAAELLGRGRVGANADTAADLVAREQDLRRVINELSRNLTTSSPGDERVRGLDVSASDAATRESLLRAQKAYTDLSLEIRERAPRHAALVSRETAAWHDVAARLGAREVLVEYLLGEPRSLAFVITRDTMLAVELAAGRRELARLVDFVRGTLQPRGTGRLDSLWRAPLRRLHDDLIAPLERTGVLREKSRLIIVPHAELHYLPFAALRTGDGPRDFLVQQYEVATTPSASVWLALASRAQPAASGVLALAPRPNALPGSRAEVASLARLGAAPARVLIGPTATEAAFVRLASTRRVIHLATYGVLNRQNPLFSFVELAQGNGGDGRLEAHEVFGLQLRAHLVVLSACQTGLASGTLADVPAGDDWVGLARAFLSAGAANIVASLWAVEDSATARLMTRFYSHYAENPDAITALASAQRAMLSDATDGNPWYWAGFQHVGGR